MIPGKIIAFLQHASIGVAGTRDKNLTPHFHKVSGWWVDEDGETMGCLIPEQFTRDLVPSLEDNGQFALSVSQIGSHETYQFKGVYVDHRPAGGSDTEVYEQCRHRFVEAVAIYFQQIPPDAARDYYLPPAMGLVSSPRNLPTDTRSGRRQPPGASGEQSWNRRPFRMKSEP